MSSLDLLRKQSKRCIWQILHPGQPLAAILTETYFKRRDQVIGAALENIRDGNSVEVSLSDVPALDYDERLIEYIYLASWIKSIDSNVHLDVGCTLNNAVVDSLLKNNFDEICFRNPAQESVKVSLPHRYQISRLDQPFAENETFASVSCLSTLEHIGYDNSQYGSQEPAKFFEPTDEPLLQGLAQLVSFLAPKGNLLVSVPYGYREVLTHPVTFRQASQVFDFQSVEKALALFESLNIKAEVQVYEVQGNRWRVSRDPRTCTARYAQGCPAAKAVVFLQCRKV